MWLPLRAFTAASRELPLYVRTGVYTAYGEGGSINLTNGPSIDCKVIIPPPTPNQRSAQEPIARDAAEPTADWSVELYPNPSSDKVKLISPDHNTLPVTISDLTGKQVYSAVVTEGEIDLSFLNEAVYVLEISTEGKAVLHKKLIVSKQ